MDLSILALAAAYLAIGFLKVWAEGRGKRKLAYTVHVQGRTEEAETLDFGVQLYEDETPLKWSEKIGVALQMCEDRRRFNNERMMEIMKKAEERRKEAQKTGNA